MPSLHDRNYPRPIVIEEDKSVSWILVIISIVIIIIFWIWIIYIIRTNPETGNPVIFCAPGQCATEISTGIKNCPIDITDVKRIDPATQVCNSPTTCENATTPFALQSDGSTNSDGICEEGAECQCLQDPQCGYHITAYFSTQNGDALQGVDSQKVVLLQNTSSSIRTGNVQTAPPFRLSSATSQFCAIPNNWLDHTWPNTGIATSLRPCVSGTMAYLPDNPDEFGLNSLNTTSLGCVQGVACPTGQISFWNNKTYRVECLNFPF